jgi:hypothetical protein
MGPSAFSDSPRYIRLTVTTPCFVVRSSNACLLLLLLLCECVSGLFGPPALAAQGRRPAGHRLSLFTRGWARALHAILMPCGGGRRMGAELNGV